MNRHNSSYNGCESTLRSSADIPTIKDKQSHTGSRNGMKWMTKLAADPRCHGAMAPSPFFHFHSSLCQISPRVPLSDEEAEDLVGYLPEILWLSLTLISEEARLQLNPTRRYDNQGNCVAFSPRDPFFMDEQDRRGYLLEAIRDERAEQLRAICDVFNLDRVHSASFQHQ
ncbi:hypothetical protein N7471_004368 [Penicillium samsonianum]|uniref:uncharacterized protein n=1 Tax=Penicillium samsonianum TaxID=1882272 RepID=UPI002547F03E|nr:uncharacterized protein N7471_004368 [Penicillium samsonianum]KAJ6137882.1 hypothetical protein N7471_004368 [Penicillium samsonianum]